MRISIVGSSCAGKSTLAKKISERLRLSYIEQDRLFWLPGWQLVSEEKFKESVAEKIAQHDWVICGNFRESRELVLSRASHVVWLNYPLPLILARALRRSATRVFKRQECCNGNYESFRHAFLSKNSIFYWILKTRRDRTRQYRQESKIAEERGITFLEFRSPREAEKWLRSL